MLCPGSNALMSWPPLQGGSWKIYKYVRAYVYLCVCIWAATAHTINKNYKLYDEGAVGCVSVLVCLCGLIRILHPESCILDVGGGVEGGREGRGSNSNIGRTSANDLINHRVRQRNIWDICSWSVAPQQQQPQPGRADGLGIAEVVIGPAKKARKKGEKRGINA